MPSQRHSALRAVQPLHVLTVLQLCAQAQAAGIEVAVCGEMAGLAEFAPALVERGVTELSMAPARIPAIKALLRGESASGNQA